MINEIIPKNLQIILEQLGMTGRELSRRCGINHATIARTLAGTGTCNALVIEAICKSLNISADELLGLKPLSPKFYPNIELINDHEQYLPLISQNDAATWNKQIQDIFPNQWRTWIKTDLQLSDMAFAIQVNDNKNSPIFPEGSILAIEPLFELEHAIFVLAKMRGSQSSFIRKILIEEPETYLQPLNTQVNASLLTQEQVIIGKIMQLKVTL